MLLRQHNGPVGPRPPQGHLRRPTYLAPLQIQSASDDDRPRPAIIFLPKRRDSSCFIAGSIGDKKVDHIVARLFRAVNSCGLCSKQMNLKQNVIRLKSILKSLTPLTISPMPPDQLPLLLSSDPFNRECAKSSCKSRSSAKLWTRSTRNPSSLGAVDSGAEFRMSGDSGVCK